ncbi:hypothetical protein [Verrucomicrobium spinosum]|uniref:hypothetical protein n=1 Tax=Verrucomicrobium spinosum TaxID=2736 RepID=UPI00210D3817|nr:hypothetical protein [Verrucomicrobium spinosum]
MLKPFVPTIGIEVGPMEQPEYARMVHEGAEGLVVYQETYDRTAYQEYHTMGPKRDFDWRLECPERGYAGGFRRMGLGACWAWRIGRRKLSGWPPIWSTCRITVGRPRTPSRFRDCVPPPVDSSRSIPWMMPASSNCSAPSACVSHRWASL